MLRTVEAFVTSHLMAEASYYVSINGANEGPFPVEDLRAWLGEGRLDETTQVWDGAAWQPLGDFLKTLALPSSPPVQAQSAPAKVVTPSLPAKEFEALGGLDTRELEELSEAEDQIDKAWKAGLVVGAITLLVAVILIFVGPTAGINGWFMLIDAALCLGLAYGIRRNSRTCAIVMFIYYIASKISYWSSTGAGGGIYIWGLTLVIAYWFLMAIFGTFTWHKVNAAAQKVQA